MLFFRSLMVTLYALLRGSTSVKTVVTPLELHQKHTLLLPSGKRRVLGFRCRQFKHSVEHDRWYIPNKTFYIYSVEMISVDDMNFTDHHVSYYPHMCSKHFANTRTGHWQAIHAHLDAIKQHNS